MARMSQELENRLRERRTNPYYILVSAMFAVILGQLARWVSDIVSRLLPHTHSISRQLDGLTDMALLAKAQMGDLLGKLTGLQQSALSGLHYRAITDSAEALQKTIGSLQTSLAQMVASTPLTVGLVQLAMAGLVFIYVVHVWFIFSRAVVYHEENTWGELITFLLGFVILCAVSALPSASPENWLYILAGCTLAISGKSFHLFSCVHKANLEPLMRCAGQWRFATLYIGLGMAILGFVVYGADALRYAIVGAALIGYSFYVFWTIRSLEGDLVIQMNRYYWNQRLPAEGARRDILVAGQKLKENIKRHDYFWKTSARAPILALVDDITFVACEYPEDSGDSTSFQEIGKLHGAAQISIEDFLGAARGDRQCPEITDDSNKLLSAVKQYIAARAVAIKRDMDAKAEAANREKGLS